MSTVTAELVRQFLQYDPESGIFTWIKRPNAMVAAGDIAGTCHKGALTMIGLRGRKYPAARLAFLWMTGRWPVEEVDHIDRNPLNDRWANLREASRQQNAANRMVPRKSGLPRGVYPSNKSGRFYAMITIGRECVYLGTFDTPDEAHKAFMERARATNGDFVPDN
jgi:hypothetical protein